LTRRVADLFSEQLVQVDQNKYKVSDPFSSNTLTQIHGLSPQVMLAQKETQAPAAFTYSLFYVFYDQYTYIRGVLAQNALLGVAAVILSLQVLSSLSIAVIIGVCVFLVLF